MPDIGKERVEEMSAPQRLKQLQEQRQKKLLEQRAQAQQRESRQQQLRSWRSELSLYNRLSNGSTGFSNGDSPQGLAPSRATEQKPRPWLSELPLNNTFSNGHSGFSTAQSPQGSAPSRAAEQQLCSWRSEMSLNTTSTNGPTGFRIAHSPQGLAPSRAAEQKPRPWLSELPLNNTFSNGHAGFSITQSPQGSAPSRATEQTSQSTQQQPSPSRKDQPTKLRMSVPQQLVALSSPDSPESQPRSYSLDAASKQMAQLKISPRKMLYKIESSPDGTVYQGTKGRKCSLEVNYLRILVDTLIPSAFHYDVEFTPDVPKKLLPKALDTLMETYFPEVFFAFDGRKNFYTNVMLELKGVSLNGSFEQEVEAVLGDRSKKFKVKVKFATEVDLSVLRSYQDCQFQHNDKPSQAIQCLDVIIRTAFKSLTSANRAVNVGRALYMPTEGRPMDLGDGMELWLGLFQSALLGRKSLYLNVDVAHKAFPSAMPVLNYLKTFDRNGKVIPNSLDRYKTEQLNEFLKMLTIEYRNPEIAPRTFGFNGLKGSPKDEVFYDKDNNKMSVLEYFKKSYPNLTLKYPNLPCLHVGSKAQTIYLPLELCWIVPGQATNKKCTPDVLRKMIGFSATSTDVRKQKIKSLLGKINYDGPNGEIKRFGINVQKDFQKVEGRVIDPPQIQYEGGRKVKPAKGVWNGLAFIETQNEEVKWGIVNCDSRTTAQTLKPFVNLMLKEAEKQGMRLSSFRSSCYHILDMTKNRTADLQAQLEELAQQDYKLVVVIIIDRNDCYAKVKQAAELKVGILTQCIKASTIFKKGTDLATINNILLKLNAKLGGKNHEVIETYYQKFNNYQNSDGVMFVGADVTHPSPDQRDIPSVVGVAASHDDIGFRYQCAWRLQNPKQEMIVDLENILTDQLLYYKTKNGKLPTKIMYYRDGVSEGQFTEVLNIEMKAIRGAMKQTYGTTQHAKVTFIVVQKRHHTRFFPTSRAFSDGRFNNILPGTVVDSDIVHPFQYQFFMASHAAIQGVTKPTKYCVLVNESKMPPDDLQAITYDLCHLFTRCNRSVSYPAPTYYAHLVAARGKQYTIGKALNMANLQEEFDNRTINPHFSSRCPMFFV